MVTLENKISKACLVTEVVTAALAVGQTVPGVVTNIRGGDEETAPADRIIFITFLLFYDRRKRGNKRFKIHYKEKFLK